MVTETKFTFLAGVLCLDFINTVGTRQNGEPAREKLRGAHDLARWIAQSGIAAQAPKPFRRSIELREALWRIFDSTLDGRSPGENDLKLLNRELAAARARERLIYAGREFRIERDPSLLGAIARSAADLLTSDDLARVRRCPGEACGWLFLDTSRNGSRQWCDMRICGNRAKARHFRERARKA